MEPKPDDQGLSNAFDPASADPKLWKARREYEEQLHRQAIEKADADLARERERWAFRGVLILLGATFAIAVLVLFLPNSSAEAQSWARATFTSFITLWTGYLGGRATK